MKNFVWVILLMCIAVSGCRKKSEPQSTPEKTKPQATVPTPKLPIAPKATKNAQPVPDATVKELSKLGGKLGQMEKEILDEPVFRVRYASSSIPVFHFTVAENETLPKLPKIDVPFGLSLTHLKFNPSVLDQLTDQPNLILLDLSGVNLTPEDIARFSRFKGLLWFQLKRNLITDDMIKAVDAAGLLEPFARSRSNKIELNDGPKPIEWVTLFGTKITLAGLKPLLKFKTITFFTFDHHLFTDDLIQHFSDAGLLHALPEASSNNLLRPRQASDVTAFAVHGRKISDAGFAKVHSVCPNLKQVTLNDTLITDSTMKLLEGAPLTHLELNKANITDASVTIIGKMKTLTSLNISHAGNTVDSMRDIGQLNKLEFLTLNGKMYADAGLSHLKNLSKLKNLSLFQSSISDASLMELAELKELKFLFLGQSNATAEGIEKLRQALPNCKISH